MNQKDTFKLNFSEKITLASEQEHLQDLNLEEAPTITTSGVTGKVKDQSGNLISGATVKLFDTTFNPLTHTTTNENGEYIFQDIENGHYHVYAVKDGYSLSNKTDLNYSGNDITMNDLIITLDPSYIKGNIYGYIYDETDLGLNNVQIKLFDSHGNIVSETISAEDGEYILSKIDAGTYTITAYATNYITSTPLSIEVTDNNNLQQNINLSKIIINKSGTINGTVYNSHKNPIPNALVGLYEQVTENSLILRNTCYTNSEGKYFFGSVEEGTWVVKAKVTGQR